MLEATVGDKASTFDNSAYSGQQDCNDEAINTTGYLRLLKQAGYLTLHVIEDMRTRNFFFTGMATYDCSDARNSHGRTICRR